MSGPYVFPPKAEPPGLSASHLLFSSFNRHQHSPRLRWGDREACKVECPVYLAAGGRGRDQAGGEAMDLAFGDGVSGAGPCARQQC